MIRKKISRLEIEQQPEKMIGSGSLKIFFGMSPGVGKTYAMLKEAQRLQAEGVDIVLGIINTHGRKETAFLMEGLPIIPEKKIIYKGNAFGELDIEAIIKRSPEIVLVDELAHTNIPGSLHPKRWQDVFEILDAGINVYTTLNVQHMESRKNVVEEITGIVVRETVPDSILERADQIELIDITPTALRMRLQEGKVYFGSQSEQALKNFFKEDHLNALREIVLRLTAEKINHDLHNLLPAYKKIKLWKSSECLMVPITPSPNSQTLIRTTRRYAFTLDAPWIAVYVNNGRVLSQKENEQLVKNLSLARDLGAEVITATDPDINVTLQRIVNRKKVTQIIISRPTPHFMRHLFMTSSLKAMFNWEPANFDIHIIRRDETLPPLTKFKLPSFKFVSPLKNYIWAAIAALAVIFPTYLYSHVYIFHLPDLIFVMSQVLFNFFFSSGPLLLAILLFFLTRTFILYPTMGLPFLEFKIGVFFTITSTALAIFLFSKRINDLEFALREEEERTQILYEVVKEIAAAPTLNDLLKNVCVLLGNILDGKFEIFLGEFKEGLTIGMESELLTSDTEKFAATWVFETGECAGLSTETYPTHNILYIPLKSYKEIVGVLVFKPSTSRKIPQEEIELLLVIGKQLASHIERSMSEEKTWKKESLQQAKKIQDSFLSFIAKELGNPIDSLKDAVRELHSSEVAQDPRMQSRKIKQIEDSTNKLQSIVENILKMSVEHNLERGIRS